MPVLKFDQVFVQPILHFYFDIQGAEYDCLRFTVLRGPLF